MRCRGCGRRISRYSKTALCPDCARTNLEVRERIREGLRAHYERTTYATLGRGDALSDRERERLLRNVGRLNPGLLPALIEAMEEWGRHNRRRDASLDAY